VEAADGAAPPGGRRRALVVSLVCVALLYVALLLWLPAQVFWPPDEGAKLLQALSHRPGGSSSGDIAYGGRDLDPDLTFYPRLLHPRHPEALRSALFPQPTAKGGVRTHWPPLFPVASRAPYRLLGARGLHPLPLQALGAVVAAVGAVSYASRDGERRPRLEVVGVVVACLLTGALYQARGVRELAIGKGALEACRREVVAAPRPVVTDLYWLPAALAETFAERPLFTLQDRQDLGRWLERVGADCRGFLLVTSAAERDEVEGWLASVTGRQLQAAGVRPLAGLVVVDVAVGDGEAGG
jgi:hypothetical protein